MIEGIFDDVVKAIDQQKFEYAVSQLQKIVEATPNSLKGWILLGICIDEPELARVFLKRANQLDPDNWLVREFQNKLAEISSQNPNESFAIVSFLTSIELQTALDFMPKKKATPKKNNDAAGRPNFVLSIVFGFVFVSLIFTMIWIYLRKSPGSESAISTTATSDNEQLALPPTLTATLSLSSTTTPTFTSGPFDSFEDRYQSVIDEMAQARRNMENEEFVEAIFIWDQIINIVPEYAEAFFQRGLCYLNLYGNQRILEEARNNLNHAYQDFSEAININPTNGDYYYQRAAVLVRLRGLEEFWIDYLDHYELAYQDMLEANRLGNRYQWSERTLGFYMTNIGRCQEAIEYFEELAEMAGPNAPESAGIHTGLAAAYSCLGQDTVALEHIEIAIEQKPSSERYKARMYYLYYVGRYTEAYNLLSESIEENPSYGGDRYYLRALVSIALKNFEQAEDDLVTGFSNTWGTYSTRAYAYGLLAMEQGDTSSALEWFQLAQASFSPVQENQYFVVQTARYIRELGGTPLYPTSTLSANHSSPTGIPHARELLYATPTAFPGEGTEIAGSYDFDISANFDGTGPMVFLPGDYPIIRFRPSEPIQVYDVKSLHIKIEGGDIGEETTLQMMTRSFISGGYANPINLLFGEADIRNTNGMVTQDGTIYVAIRNFSSTDQVVVENISLRLVVINSDGSETAYGFR